MAMDNEKLVLREGQDWMELRRVDPRGRLWLVTGGTAGMAGDIVRLPRLRMYEIPGDSDLSPFEAEVVVDAVTRTVLLPESGKPSWPQHRAAALLATLKKAGLVHQAKIVREWLGPTVEKRSRNAA